MRNFFSGLGANQSSGKGKPEGKGRKPLWQRQEKSGRGRRSGGTGGKFAGNPVSRGRWIKMGKTYGRTGFKQPKFVGLRLDRIRSIFYF
ncbi:MAG: hypothetical protein BAA03_01205 [Caldibacillus debilis]|nr:MAG: hypothetical protein BAA03_01205 [Caldibacillus debilis]